VTENGAAKLRGRSYRERAEALIAIAPPTHRAVLDAAWAVYAARF
jgi:acyl-CoA hydrolase